ncbi:DinB family protein [Microlunatus elymi]|uniref:DinB family protein n=1 Tax=Microlunatus elymi TaxID=2596828 RepID=A0A516Q0L7_9ACTN|nr:DinB family protein [Microlunatus elymi]QDP96948.1 DinB family protein [Microlunatus elymi]
MADFSEEDLHGSTFHKVDLRDSRFTDVRMSGVRIRSADLSDMIIRAVDADRTQLDAPWLYNGSLIINDVDVVPLVDAELNRRFPGRANRRAADPDGLRTAWAALERAWDGVVDRARSMPDGTVDISVGDEWSFAQTLRHLVLATDMWLGKAVLRRRQPFHPLGLIDAASADELDPAVLAVEDPGFADVLDARADRMGMVRDFLAAVTAEELAEQRPNPHDPQYSETVRSCLHTILEEEWEHQRYAVRDLDRIAADRPAATPA